MKRIAILLGLLGVVLVGCPKDEALTRNEAQEALTESEISSQADALTGATVEIGTEFTIGEGVEMAAQRIRDAVTTALPCAEVTVMPGRLSIAYGARAGSCVYRGQTLSGTHTITVMRNEMTEVVVNHTWTDLSNGRVEVDGMATVTWSAAERSRRVQHNVTWTRLSDGRTGTGTGDRTQRALPGGIAEGISVDGTRTWDGERGEWSLDIDDVEMRWVDPVPQAGRYTLETPFGKSLSLSFARKDANTITVTVANGRRDFSFDVTSLR